VSLPALKLTSDVSPAMPAHEGPIEWLWLEDASARAGLKSDGALRRRCFEEWQHNQLARKVVRENGRESWQVASIADPRFIRVKSPEALTDQFDVTQFTEAQRTILLERERIVRAYVEQRSAGIVLGLKPDEVIQRFIAGLVTPLAVSRSTLHGWHAAWRKSGRAGLVDQRWLKERPRDEAYPIYREQLLRAFLDKRPKSIRLCHEIAATIAEQQGERAPAETTARRIIDALPEDVRTRRREGEKAYEDKHLQYIDRDYSTIDSNDIWNADHHRFDVMVNVGVDERGKPKFARPWLHAWQDVRSRKIVGWSIVLHDPNADLILRTFNRAMDAHFVPGKVYLDNGKDFDAKVLQSVTKKQRRAGVQLSAAEVAQIGGAFTMLGIGVMHCWPYHGQSKPIERFFRTVCERFSVLWETYCGKDVLSRPEDHAEKLAAGHAPTLEELTAAFTEWLENDYHHRIHLGDSMHGQTPAQVWQQCLQTRRTLPAELRDFACRSKITVTVQQNGVKWKGLTWGTGMPQLIERLGEKVQIAINVDDLSSVLVIGCEGKHAGKLICRAPATQKGSWLGNSQAHREAIAAKRRQAKLNRQHQQQRTQMAMDIPDLMLSAAAKKAQAQQQALARTGTDDVPMQHVRTAFDGEFASLSKAVQTQIEPPVESGGFSMSLSNLMASRQEDHHE
jgi:hypothetical protein